MRLIDADNLVSLCEIMADKTDSPQIWEQLISMIESVPTIEAEPVVHCIDCITDEIAQKIIEEANKTCANCQEWACDECEYRHWRNKG